MSDDSSESTEAMNTTEPMRTIERTLAQETVVHLVGGTVAEADTLVEKIGADRDLDVVTVACDEETTTESVPAARLPDGVLVYYPDFGALSSEVQITAAQWIKGNYDYGTPVVVRSDEKSRGDLTLHNGDLVGRVRSVEL